MRRTTVGLASVAMLLVLAAPSSAALIVTNNSTALDLVNAVTAGNTGIIVTGWSLYGHTSGSAVSSGTYTDTGPGSGTYGLGGTQGVVLSTGNAGAYGSGSNTVGSTGTGYAGADATWDALLDPITGGKTHYDVTALTIDFDMEAGKNSIFFDVVWGTEEYAEWIGSSFIDAFGLYVNGTNIATVGGLPINVDHPNMAGISGTELDGVLYTAGSARHTFSSLVHATGNSVTFIIADSGDSVYDSTAYITALGAELPEPEVPEPGSIAAMLSLMGFGAGAMVVRRRRAKKLAA